ncbi:MAG: hypothetical protein U5P41_07070 [Gammaproteobacteria bacterium]|nr:hypothetical protein [Gammaproteobacteria bacterium]
MPRKFLPDFTAQLQTRFVLASNELPRLHDSSGALPSRFLILMLTRSWLGREDGHMSARLMDELPGTFPVVAGGLSPIGGAGPLPATNQRERNPLETLKDLSSPIGAFLRDRCLVHKDAEVGKDELYTAWRDWCDDHGRAGPEQKKHSAGILRAAVPGLRVNPTAPIDRHQDACVQGH